MPSQWCVFKKLLRNIFFILKKILFAKHLKEEWCRLFSLKIQEKISAKLIQEPYIKIFKKIMLMHTQSSRTNVTNINTPCSLMDEKQLYWVKLCPLALFHIYIYIYINSAIPYISHLHTNRHALTHTPTCTHTPTPSYTHAQTHLPPTHTHSLSKL